MTIKFPQHVSPHTRSQILFSLGLLGYSVFLGGIYSSIYFGVWVVTHLLGLILIGAGLLWPSLTQKTWPASSLDGPILLLALCMAVSGLLAAYPRLALEGFYPWLCQTLAFYTAIRFMRRGWADVLLRALMLVTGVVILIGLFEAAAWYFGLPLSPQFAQGWWQIGGWANPIPPLWYRLSFTLSNAVELSAYLVLVIPVSVAFLFSTPQKSDRAMIGLFILAELAVFIFTFSRGGMLGLAAGLVSLGGLWLWQNYAGFSGTQKTAVKWALGAGGFISAGAVVFLIGQLWTPDRASGDAIRGQLIQAALYLYQQYPLLGLGPGMFRWGWRLTPFTAAIADRVVTAHNLYLNQLAELGTLGGLAGLGLIVMAALTFYRTLKNAADPRLRWRYAGCAAGLSGFLVQAVLETFTTWPIAVPVIILTAYLVAPVDPFLPDANRQKPGRISRPAISRAAAITLSVLWLVTTLAITYFAYPRWLAEQARKEAAGKHYQTALTLIEQSIRLDPTLALYQFERATWLANLLPPDYQTAQETYQAALKRDPTYSINYANLAAVEWQLGRRQEALGHIHTAAALSPTVNRLVLAQGYYAEEAGDEALARTAYSQVIGQNTWLSNSPYWQATPWRAKNFPGILEQVLQSIPPIDRAAILFNLHLQAGLLTETQADLNELARLNPEGYAWFLSAAKLNLAEGNFAQALTLAQKAVALRPDLGEPYALQAEILLNLGQMGKAEQAARRPIFLKQNAGQAWYVLGKVYETRGNYPAAETAYQRGYQPETYSLDYAPALYRQYSNVILPLPDLPRLGDESGDLRAWIALAKLYQKQEKTGQAIQVYQAVLQQNPYLKTVEQQLADLCQANENGCTGK